MQAQLTRDTSVLVVDDETTVRNYVGAALERNGFTVQLADSGAAALAFLEHQRYDLLLTDISMPEMTGLEVVLEARAIHPDISIVMMSGYFEGGIPADHTFLQKPFTIAELVKAVKSSLD